MVSGCGPTSRRARRPSCTVTWRGRCSMARNRASMREGPLAELFRATEAAQGKQQNEQQQLPTEAAETPKAEEPVPAEPTPIRAVPEAPAADPPTDTEERRPLARWLEPLPDPPAR